MSRCLAERSIDHVVLERGEVANSWRFERWDSLRLLARLSQLKQKSLEYQGGTLKSLHYRAGAAA